MREVTKSWQVHAIVPNTKLGENEAQLPLKTLMHFRRTCIMCDI
jgi:hypothetical protein